MHSVPAADLSDWDDYEINLDQRVLSPEICMAACMAAPAGRPAVIPSHRMEDYCAQKTALLVGGGAD